jgi:hypothetical protein
VGLQARRRCVHAEGFGEKKERLKNGIDAPKKGMLSCQQTQNVIDGKKRIILNPTDGQKKDFETVTFAEGEVYGIDILISSGEDGKVRFPFSPQ